MKHIHPQILTVRPLKNDGWKMILSFSDPVKIVKLQRPMGAFNSKECIYLIILDLFASRSHGPSYICQLRNANGVACGHLAGDMDSMASPRHPSPQLSPPSIARGQALPSRKNESFSNKQKLPIRLLTSTSYPVETPRSK